MLRIMIYVKIIKHAKFSYSLIKSQLLPCAPACSYKFHALAVYLHYIFKAPFQSKPILNPVERLRWSFFVEIVDVFRPLAIFPEEFHRECLTGF